MANRLSGYAEMMLSSWASKHGIGPKELGMYAGAFSVSYEGLKASAQSDKFAADMALTTLDAMIAPKVEEKKAEQYPIKLTGERPLVRPEDLV